MTSDLHLPGALRELGDALRAAELTLAVPGRDEAAAARRELLDQVEDYLLPRLERMDAPLLMVVGGSTGAGKSTLVNSLAGADVSPAGVLRPTTRAPVLVCHPDDLAWFEDDRILPGMSRTRGSSSTAGSLQLVPTEALQPGLALLDSPDIDSVVEANRALSRQLLAAADAWLFVTTAARYADAVPWELLQAARDRGTALSLVLDRVPPEAVEEVGRHLRGMIAERGLEGTRAAGGRGGRARGRPAPRRTRSRPCASWLDALAADGQARAGLVRRTLTGALDSLPRRAGIVARALAEQAEAARALREDARRRYARGLRGGRRGGAQRRAAARRGPRPLARRHRDGRHDARARVPARPAARPGALAGDGRAGGRGRAAHRGRDQRRRGGLRGGRPRRGARRRRLARPARRARAAGGHGSPGRRLAGPAAADPRGGPRLAGRRLRARQPRGRRQALHGADRVPWRQRRRTGGHDRRLRPHRRADGCRGGGRGRDLGGRPARAGGAARGPGRAHARREGPRGPAGARPARCSADEAARYDALLAAAAPSDPGLGRLEAAVEALERAR